MTEKPTHAETGIEISNTFGKQCARFHVAIDDLPSDLNDLRDEIEQLTAEIEHIDQQIALEAGGATNLCASDPDWARRAPTARRMLAGRRGVLRGWERRLNGVSARSGGPGLRP